MENLNNKVIRFLLDDNSRYTPIQCEEAAPGITYLTLGIFFDSPDHRDIQETLLVPTNISQTAIDILSRSWEKRIMEENNMDIEDCIDSMVGMFTFGEKPIEKLPATTRHEDLVQQTLADVANGAQSPICVPYRDAIGKRIGRADTIRHADFCIEFKVIPHGCYDLAIQVPLTGCQDQVIPLCELGNFDAETYTLRDWVVVDSL